MPRIVTIQFITAGKLYDFDAGELEISPRDKVIVETERGTGIASVVAGPVEREVNDCPPTLLPVKRVATRDDLETLARNARKEQEAFEFCTRRIIERNMQMKLVRVEYLFDGSKAVFFFTADGRVDFRDLVKDLAHTFHTRIEMRQIGVRDESKMTGGIGICGRELCCCSWLREFQPVSVKMAKEQNLALNPSKISGQCGRLLCCLDYEYETYCGLRKSFPKCGKRVKTDMVSGVVDKMNILTGNITLKLDDGKLVIVKRTEITGEVAPGDAPQPRSEAPHSQPPRQQKQRERRQGQDRQDRPERTERPERPERHERHERPASTRNEGAPPPSAPGQPAGGQQQAAEGQPKQGRKKHRPRRHGQRKPGGGTPDGGGLPPKSSN